MIDRKKCLYYREGSCINPLRCHSGFKIIRKMKLKTVKTCSIDGDILQRLTVYEIAEITTGASSVVLRE